jgi:hypothetical protein
MWRVTGQVSNFEHKCYNVQPTQFLKKHSPDLELNLSLNEHQKMDPFLTDSTVRNFPIFFGGSNKKQTPFCCWCKPGFCGQYSDNFY